MAASMPQYPSCFSSRTHSIKLVPSISRSCKFKLPKSSASSTSEPEPEDTDPVKLAFAKARAYKKAIQSNNPIPKITPNPVLESSQNGMNFDGSASDFDNNGDSPVFADLLKQYNNNEDDAVSGGFSKAEIIVGDASKFAEATSSQQPTKAEEDSGLDKLKVSSEPVPDDNDPVKLAFAKAREYKEVVQSKNATFRISPDQVRESSETLINREPVSEYTNNGDALSFADLLKQMAKGRRDSVTDDTISETFSGDDLPVAEIIVGDSIEVALAAASEPNTTLPEDWGQYKPKFTSWNNSPSTTIPENEAEFPKVEIIVGDASKFARSKRRITLEEESGLYKEVVQSKSSTPKISLNQVRESPESWMTKEESVSPSSNNVDTPSFADLLKQMAKQSGDNNIDDTISEPFPEGDLPEVETIVGDASKFGQAVASEPNKTLKEDSRRHEPKFTSWGNPQSAATFENESDFPEVEIIVGDWSKFARSKPRITLEEESGLYKPKVSSEPVPVENDPVKYAFAKTSAYKEVVQSKNPIPKISLDQVRESSESWINKGDSVSQYPNNADTSFADLLKQMAKQSGDNNTDDAILEPFSEGEFPEVETIVEDTSKFGQGAASEPNKTFNEVSGRYEPKFTSWGNPSSATTSENESDFPEVEIIVGDASKFARSKPRITLEEESGLYKPKISSTPVPVDSDPVKIAGEVPEVKTIVGDGNKVRQGVASEPNKVLKEDSGRYEPRVTSWGSPPRSTTSENEGGSPVWEIVVGDASKFARSKPRITLEEESGLYKSKVSSEPVPFDKDPVKLAKAKATAYKEVVRSNNPSSKISPNQESWMNIEESVSENTNYADTPAFADLLNQMAKQSRDNTTNDTISEPFPEEHFPEVDTIVGDPSKFGQVAASDANTALKENSGQYKPKVASWGNPQSDSTFENESNFPEVEIIVGDASKFVRSKPRITLEEESGLYKSKVSSEPTPVDNDPVKLAFAKASAYKEVVQFNNPTPKISQGQVEQSSESQMKKEGSVLGHINNGDAPSFADLLKQMAKQREENNTDDTISVSFPEEDLLEVEINVGDASKFGRATSSDPNSMLEENSGQYKSKATPWSSPPSTTDI